MKCWHSNNSGAMCYFNIRAVSCSFRWHLYLQGIVCLLQKVEEVAFVIYCSVQREFLVFCTTQIQEITVIVHYSPVL